MIASIARFEKLNARKEKSHGTYNRKLTECVLASKPNALYDKYYPLGALVIHKTFFIKNNENGSFANNLQYVEGTSEKRQRVSDLSLISIREFIDSPFDRSLWSILQKSTLFPSDLEVDGVRDMSIETNADENLTPHRTNFTSTFRVKLSKDTSQISVIGFSTERLHPYTAKINGTEYRIQIGINEFSDMAFVRLSDSIKRRDGTFEDRYFESLYIFNTKCKLTCNVLSSRFNSETVSEFENDALYGLKLEGPKESVIHFNEKIQDILTILAEFKRPYPDSGSIYNYLLKNMPVTRYVDRINRSETSGQNGIIIDDKMAAHHRRFLLEISNIHFTFACLRSVAAVLLRVCLAKSTNDPYHEKGYPSYKALNIYVEEFIKGIDLKEKNTDLLKLYVRLDLLAQLVGNLFKYQTHSDEFLDLRTGTPDPSYHPFRPQFEALVKDKKELGEYFLDKASNFGHILARYLIEKGHPDIHLMDSLTYKALSDKEKNYKNVVIKRATGKKIWDSHSRNWKTSFKIESCGKFFLNIKDIMLSKIDNKGALKFFTDGYDLKKELPKYNAQRDPHANISVTVIFKETYNFLLRVPHQDIYTPSGH